MAYSVNPRYQPAIPSGRGSLFSRLFGPLAVVALMWIAFILQPFMGREAWYTWGINAGDFSQPWTYFTSVFLHGSFNHISGNSTFMLLLGVIIGLEGTRRWLAVFAGSAVSAGLFVSALTPVGITVGASGVVFGYFGYILTAALVERTPWVKVLRIVVAVALFGAYSATILVGFLPSDGVSWQAHVGGFIGGVIVAIIAERHVEPRKQLPAPPNPYTN